MKRFLRFLAYHKNAIILSFVLLAVGASFRWEVAEIDDATTRQRITTQHRVVLPWTPCGATTGGGRLVNFRVRHWQCYGLVRAEATGQTM
jgi:hypothetical protein